MIRTIAICLASLALAACAARPVDTACMAFEPISYSATGDTVETVTQVRRHNAAWTALCK
jgi:hypothetical protein